MSAATDLYDLAEELLDLCVVALDELPAGAPDRAYVSLGLPAIDCEQLTVHCLNFGEIPESINPASPMDRWRNANPVPRLVNALLVVTIQRCYPGPTMGQTPTIPPASALAAASAIAYADAWQIWNAIGAALRDGGLFSDGSGCRFVAWQAAAPLGPSGDFAGWTIPIQVQIDGFTPPPPV